MLLRKGDTLGYVGTTGDAPPERAAPALRRFPAGTGEELVEGNGAQPAADAREPVTRYPTSARTTIQIFSSADSRTRRVNTS